MTDDISETTELKNLPHARLPAQDADDLERIEAVTSTVAASDIVIGLAVLVATWPVALGSGWIVGRAIDRLPGREHYKRAVVRAVRASIAFVGLAVSLSRFGVDVGWFTVGLVFVGAVLFLMLRPLVENLAAGLVLETRRSFGVGDEIKTKGYTGEVIEVNGRTTVLKLRDWRSVHIPSTDVLDDSIVVYTGLGRRRSSIELWVGDDADLDDATRVAVDATSQVEGVLEDPAPSVVAFDFGNGTVGLQLRWWHGPTISEEKHTRDRVVRELAVALRRHGIDLPAPEIRVEPEPGT